MCFDCVYFGFSRLVWDLITMPRRLLFLRRKSLWAVSFAAQRLERWKNKYFYLKRTGEKNGEACKKNSGYCFIDGIDFSFKSNEKYVNQKFRRCKK